jgi:5'-3' exoribonuclease 1
MGVPKFFRWLSERYPKINQVAKTDVKPEFGRPRRRAPGACLSQVTCADNLYLDMNGIVHHW